MRLRERIQWPDGADFAFTVFDGTDFATLEKVREVYALLGDLGFRTTKSVWPVRGSRSPNNEGATCEDARYLEWLRGLAAAGFEIGLHNATFHTSTRAETRRALEEFRKLFGDYPRTMANHVGCSEGIYWGDARLEGLNRTVYNLLTRYRRQLRFRGHVPGDKLFWGDLCRETICYVRNFVFRDMNTLAACPFIPYHDPRKPYVNYWFASSEGPTVARFVECLDETAQDRLESEGGACIMYTHFAMGFYLDGTLHTRFRQLMERLARKRGWFVPVCTLLDYMRSIRGDYVITPRERRMLELRWMAQKVLVGTS